MGGEIDSGATPLWPQVDRVDVPAGGVVRAQLKQARNYAVGDLHARGGMGMVLRARDLNVRRTVAMKVLPSSDAPAETQLRFVDEARITGQLEHPNIVPVHEVGVDEQERVFYTMKFVKGTTLKQVLSDLRAGDAAAAAKHPLPVRLTVFQKVCDAVAFAHARGVLHRDLKPENVMLGDYGEVLVMDWGLAKVIGQTEPHRPPAPSPHPAHSLIATARDDSRDTATMAGTVLGTPQYMAPEQARGEIERLDARADVYALGAILYELLTLRPPVEGQTTDEILAHVRAGKIVPITPALQHAIPSSLAAVALKALALRPEDRYPTVPDLQADVARYQSGFATAAENAGLGRQLALLVKRHKAVALTAAAAWLLLTALAVWFVLNVTRERNTARTERAKAERALNDLRGTAPLFFEQAKALLQQRDLTNALRLVDSALELDSAQAGFHAQRGNILQSLDRHAEAIASYREAQRIDPRWPHLDDNIGLSARFVAAGGNDPGLRHSFLTLLRAQARSSEALPVAQELGESTARQLPLVRDAVRTWLGREPVDLSVNAEGAISLNLKGLPITDLSALRGLPIGSLALGGTSVRDLSPLRGMMLRHFEFTTGPDIADVEALRGMPLRKVVIANRSLKDLAPVANADLNYLGVTGCNIEDIACLRDCPLEWVELARTRVRDHSPLAGMKLQSLSVSELFHQPEVLRGMPLRRLSLDRARAITNVAFLAEFTELDELVLPPDPGDIEFLRDRPKLRYLAIGATLNGWNERSATAERFWQEYDDRKARTKKEADALAALQARLRQRGAPDRVVSSAVLTSNGVLGVSLRDPYFATIDYLSGLRIGMLTIVRSGITNLALLDGLHIEGLEMTTQPVANLTPLAKHTELKDLRMADTKVSDLTPILGLPLREIYLARTKVTDVSPLAAMTTLEVIELPEGAAGVEKLRALPNLRRISYRWDANRREVAQTAAEFWAEFDAKQKK
jgi:tetratricopeptide (TPR) repeat protein/Leucine-rich repeat (LRR) protein